MAYSAEEKRKMERLVQAFRGYLTESRDIDIAYGEKTGYVRLITAENADWVYFPIGSFDELLQMFFSDVFSDEMDRAAWDDDSAAADFRRPYEYLCGILNTLEDDREYALGEMEKFAEQWKRNMPHV